VAQGSPEGLREIPRGGTHGLPGGAHDRGRGEQGRYREAHAGARVRRLRDRLPFKGDAFRVVYAVQLGDDIWVVHAFQKKSTQGIKTPKHEIELVRDRLKRLKELLR
jgi:phage-related protein